MKRKCECCNSSETKLYAHSACCNAHWEIQIEGEKFFIECEKCGKPLSKGSYWIKKDYLKEIK